MTPFVPEDLRATTTSVWLLIARYNRTAWNTLGTLLVNGAGADTLQDVAHERAEIAFPEAPHERVLPYPPGVLMLRSFDTKLHSMLKTAFITKANTIRHNLGLAPLAPVEIPESESKQIVEDVLLAFAALMAPLKNIKSAEVIIAPDGRPAVAPTAKTIHKDIDPGIGWMALVHPD